MGFPTRSASNIRERFSKHFSLKKIEYVPVVVKERTMDLLLLERQLLIFVHRDTLVLEVVRQWSVESAIQGDLAGGEYQACGVLLDEKAGIR